MPTSANRSGSTWCSSLPSSGRPSELASRFAGSIVSTATFSPRAAMPIAIAAEVVVLPTPPAPAQITMRLPSSRSATLTACAPARRRSQLALQLVGEPLEVGEAELGGEQVGQREHVAHVLLEAPQLGALRARAAVLRQRGAQRGRDLGRPVP